MFTRYLNADYVFLKTLFATALMLLVISYDIACQWHKNLWERMQIFPAEEALSNSVSSVLFLVPKFHLPAHVEACNLQFSFNLTKGVGRTDGEAPERGWANINPAAQSTKEMGPGTLSWVCRLSAFACLMRMLTLRLSRLYADEENPGCGAYA
jgi:hypothetical protein